MTRGKVLSKSEDIARLASFYEMSVDEFWMLAEEEKIVVSMNILRSLLQDMRQNYAVNKDAVYGIGENRGAWVIQLISEELPGYFKATYLDEKTADGKADNKAIHDWLMKEMAAQAK